jgi:outer membrane protein TolC
MALAPAAAAQEGPLRLTLEDAIARAEQNSLRVAELQARVDVAAAVEAGRDAASRPALAVLGGYTRTNHVDEYALALPNQALRTLYPDVPDNYRARMDLQWPIYTAGRQQALSRAAGAERTAAGFDVAAARLDARLEAARAFWALVTATQTEAVVQRALEALDAHLRDLRSRLDQGLIPPNDVLTAEAQRSHQQLLAIEARNLRQVAKADLRRVIGDDSRRDVEAAGVPDAPAPATPPAAGPLESARAQRPERRAIASRIEGSRERETAAAASARPQISVAGGFDYARPNPRIFPRIDEWHDSWDASVNVSWSLWDGGRRRAEQAEAAATTRALTARSADFDRQLAFEVEQRHLDLDSALAAIQATEDGVRAAIEAQRVVGERFAAGVATSTDVLDAQTSRLQAELDRTRAVAGARLAMARLDRAIGRP